MAKADRESAHVGFLRHANFRWAKFALLLCAASLVAYVWHQPLNGPNGGTWLGYTLGSIGALLVLWLLWLGVRKRRYRSSLGTVKGWTSAHVYLGLSLVVIASLHCGFQFGLNIHTLAYALMIAVVLSGLWGLVLYERLPSQISRLRDGSTRDAWIEEVFDLNEQSIRLADEMGPEVHQRIVASAEKLQMGGGLRAQLRRHARSKDADILRDLLQKKASSQNSDVFQPDRQSTMVFMAGQLPKAHVRENEARRVQQLLDLLSRRNELVLRINRDVGLHAQLQLWLLFHVPLSLGLLAALLAHVVSVFFYW